MTTTTGTPATCPPSEAHDQISVIAMLEWRGTHPDFTDSLEAYVTALKARDKAQQAFERADHRAQQREAELRAVYERLTAADAANAHVCAEEED